MLTPASLYEQRQLRVGDICWRWRYQKTYRWVHYGKEYNKFKDLFHNFLCWIYRYKNFKVMHIHAGNRVEIRSFKRSIHKMVITITTSWANTTQSNGLAGSFNGMLLNIENILLGLAGLEKRIRDETWRLSRNLHNSISTRIQCIVLQTKHLFKWVPNISKLSTFGFLIVMHRCRKRPKKTFGHRKEVVTSMENVDRLYNIFMIECRDVRATSM